MTSTISIYLFSLCACGSEEASDNESENRHQDDLHYIVSLDYFALLPSVLFTLWCRALSLKLPYLLIDSRSLFFDFFKLSPEFICFDLDVLRWAQTTDHLWLFHFTLLWYRNDLRSDQSNIIPNKNHVKMWDLLRSSLEFLNLSVLGLGFFLREIRLLMLRLNCSCRCSTMKDYMNWWILPDVRWLSCSYVGRRSRGGRRNGDLQLEVHLLLLV